MKKVLFILALALAAITILTGCAAEKITIKNGDQNMYTYSDRGWLYTTNPHAGEAAAAYSATKLADAYADAIKNGTFVGPGKIAGMVRNGTEEIVYVKHPEADIEFPVSPSTTVPLSVHCIPSFLMVRAKGETEYTKMTINAKPGNYNGLIVQFGLNIIRKKA